MKSSTNSMYVSHARMLDYIFTLILTVAKIEHFLLPENNVILVTCNGFSSVRIIGLFMHVPNQIIFALYSLTIITR